MGETFEGNLYPKGKSQQRKKSLKIQEIECRGLVKNKCPRKGGENNCRQGRYTSPLRKGKQ